jgi:diguanylate cyclase (GGDEF)-like protein
MDNDNDNLILIDDSDSSSSERVKRPWKILIADDDEQVRIATRFALSTTRILGRALELHYASSATEALAVLTQTPDIAVILLDVVMEDEYAGLELVKQIRADERFAALRIILRTGQPGYAPELEVIEKYDINDYHTKQDLTHTRLISALTAAVRSYEQIRTIIQSRLGLEKVVHASADLVERRALESFADGVLTQIALVLGLTPEGIVCVQRGSAFEESPDKLFIIGAAGQYGEFINHTLDEMPNPHIQALLQKTIDARQHQFLAHESIIYLNNGNREGAVYLHSERLLDETDCSLLEVFSSNISVGYENVSLFQSLRQAAYRDALTNLPNRLRFIEFLDDYGQQPWPDGMIMLIDIDHFADVNDALGQETGNKLLIAVANRIKDHLTPACSVARIGADMFGVLGRAQALEPEHILEMFKPPFGFGEYSIPISVTLGLCRPAGGESGLRLMKNANIALNRAKKNLRARFDYFLQEMEDQTRWRLDVIHRLRNSFAGNELQVWYQPQINLTTGMLTGMEALLRWPSSSPDEASISPAVFVPLAEYSGLIVDIGDWVMHQACETLNKLRQEGHGHLLMSVNVSVPQFRSGAFVDRVIDILHQHQIPPHQLELEITESIVIDEPKVVISALEQLRQMGIRVAIDDFGTGFSSLSYLLQLPVDRLKIDRYFVSRIGEGNGEAIAESIIHLCKRLGLRVIAEGVETHEQWQHLQRMDCEEAQGFLFAKPMPFDTLRQWLNNFSIATVIGSESID